MTQSSAIRTTLPFTRRSPPKPRVLVPVPQAHRDPFPVVVNGSSGTALLFKASYLQAVVPSPTTTLSSHLDHAQAEPFSTVGNGSSRPLHLFKRTSVHGFGRAPFIAPFPRL